MGADSRRLIRGLSPPTDEEMQRLTAGASRIKWVKSPGNLRPNHLLNIGANLGLAENREFQKHFGRIISQHIHTRLRESIPVEPGVTCRVVQ